MSRASGKGLRLAPNLILPRDFATEGVGVVGMRGSGKSNVETRWVEVLYDAGIPFVTVDPKGDWGGIRSSADGKSPGLPVPVFGGLFGDFPLDETLGRRIADLLVDENMSAVLDVSRLSIGARARFLTDFFEQLIDRHQREPHVRCVILEEAHRYIPQQVPGDLARVKEAAAAILLEGRAWGLGCWAATQRPARLNKDVMEEVGTIIVFRLGVAATNDKKTVTGWFKDEVDAPEIGRSLTKLGNGEGWIHAPQTLGIVALVQFDRRTTFDSASTPLVGRSDSRRIATMADINTAAIKEALEDAIVRAKEMDPKELAKTVAKLRADLASRPSDQDAAELAWWRSFASKFAPDELPEVGSSFTGLGPLYLAGAPLEPVELIPSSLIVARDELVGHLAGVVSAVDGMSKIIDARPSVDVATPVRKRETTNVREIRPNAGVVDIPAIGVRVERLTPDDSGSGLPSGERRLLVAIAQQRGGGATLSLLRLLSGFKTSSVKTYLTRLRGKGLVTNEGDRFHLTAGAYEILGDFEPLPTGRALRDHWLSELPDGESKILSILFGVYPHVMSVDEIVQRTPYTLSSVKTYVTRLKTKGLIVVEGGAPRASAILFEGNGR